MMCVGSWRYVLLFMESYMGGVVFWMQCLPLGGFIEEERIKLIESNNWGRRPYKFEIAWQEASDLTRKEELKLKLKLKCIAHFIMGPNWLMSQNYLSNLAGGRCHFLLRIGPFPYPYNISINEWSQNHSKHMMIK
jgi:hypothetical protein